MPFRLLFFEVFKGVGFSGKFADEDAVDSDDERKKAEEEKAAKRKAEAEAPKKVKNSKKDYEKMYADR